jgi:formylglycine-generating enzyme required for sulfatase activity
MPQDLESLKLRREEETRAIEAARKAIAELEAQPESPEREARLARQRKLEELHREQAKLAESRIQSLEAEARLAKEREIWKDRRKEIDLLIRDSRFHGAREKLLLAKQDCPSLAEEIDGELKGVEKFLKEASEACDRALARAEKERAEKKFVLAYRSCREARLHVPDVPDKLQACDALSSRVKTEALETGMVRIPGQRCPVGDPANPDHPVREVQTRTILMDSTEVTIEMFALYLLDSNAAPPPQWKGVDLMRAIGPLMDMPMLGLTYPEALEFCRWAGKRLPTEEEWERAARFVDGRPYPWGEQWVDPEGRPRANAVDAVGAAGREKIEVRRVGSFPNGRSAEGVYDLAGNVWEWTSTRVEKTVDGAPVPYQVLKGGSFLTMKEACRGFVRLLEEPEIRHMDVGFRCVRDAE